MPLTIDEIRVKKPHVFQFVEKDPELNVDLYSHPQDPRFFLLFDNYGNIAGIRTGVSNNYFFMSSLLIIIQNSTHCSLFWRSLTY